MKGMTGLARRRVVTIVMVAALAVSAWAPCAAMVGRAASGCAMPTDHGCARPSAVSQDCCVVDARAPQPPATFVAASSFQPDVRVVAAVMPPVYPASCSAVRVAYELQFLKLPHPPTYLLTSSLLI